MVVTTAAAAAGAMLINDIAAVLLVQSEARNRACLAAIFDSIMWIASISTTTISVTALQGHHLSGEDRRLGGSGARERGRVLCRRGDRQTADKRAKYWD